MIRPVHGFRAEGCRQQLNPYAERVSYDVCGHLRKPAEIANAHETITVYINMKKGLGFSGFGFAIEMPAAHTVPKLATRWVPRVVYSPWTPLRKDLKL